MVTIRPSPTRRMAVNAARQQRNEPVRLTRSVCSQISGVVSANGTDSSTAAAQTRAETGPTAAAASKRRSTSAALLTSVRTAMASPSASRIRPATPARAAASRAASTTRAPTAARASAVAAPMPRLAPVTTASRPASQWPRSSADRGCAPRSPPGRPLPLGSLTCGADDPSVKLLMSVQTPFQVEMALGVPAAGRARDAGDVPYALRGGPQVVGRDQEAGYPVIYDLAEPAAAERDHR